MHICRDGRMRLSLTVKLHWMQYMRENVPCLELKNSIDIKELLLHLTCTASVPKRSCQACLLINTFSVPVPQNFLKQRRLSLTTVVKVYTFIKWSHVLWSGAHHRNWLAVQRVVSKDKEVMNVVETLTIIWRAYSRWTQLSSKTNLKWKLKKRNAINIKM